LPDGQVRFWVKDNGNGLTPEQQAKLFTPFSRLSEHTKVEGHGLGLSIVQRIAEKLKGSVGLESAPGQGSLFYFTLPVGQHPPNLSK
jgi:signal transduction histidine kinase